MADQNESNSLQPLGSNDVDITAVAYEKVDQPGPKSFWAQLQGFWLTFATMFKKVNTVQYPEVKEPTAERFHGRGVTDLISNGQVYSIGGRHDLQVLADRQRNIFKVIFALQ